MMYTIKVSIPVISAIVKKNIIRLTRSKIAALMIIIGPLIIMLLAGIAFDQAKLYGVKVGIYAPTNDNITQSIIDSINAQDFKVISYQTSQTCITSVSDGQTNVCILFSTLNNKTHLEFNVDYSKLNLVYAIVNSLSSGLQAQSQKISLGLAEDLFDTVGKTAQAISENAQSLSKMRDNVFLMTQKLDTITQTISSVDTSAPDVNGTENVAQEVKKSQDEIKQMQSTTDNNLNSYLDKLDSLEVAVGSIESELNVLDSSTSSAATDLSKLYTAMSCASMAGVEPCSSIASTQNDMTQISKSVSSTKTPIAQLKNDIASSKSDLSSTKSGLGDMTTTAQARIAMISDGIVQVQNALSVAKIKSMQITNMKNQLQSDLTDMKSRMNSGLMDLDSFNTSLAKVVKDFDGISNSSAENLVKPIGASVKPLLANKKILDYLFPSLLVFVLTFTGILLSATIVMKEKSSPAHFRNFITPVSPLLFILGSYATALLILFVQMIILFLLGQVAFGISAIDNILPTGVVLLLTATVFIFLGMSVGYLFKSEETTTLVSISLACILLLFSSLLVPVENVKSGMASVLSLSPFNVADSALRTTLIFGRDFLSIWAQLFQLAIYAFVLFLLTQFILNQSLKRI